MSLVKSGQVITPTFTVTDPAGTGLINADSLPTGAVYVNGVVNAATVTVTNLSTGKYKATVTLPSLSAGDTVSLMISATVGGKTYADNVWQGIGDTVRLSDLATAAALTTVAGYVDTEVAAILAAVDTEVAAIKAKTDNLPSDPADQSALEAAITAAQGAVTTAIAALNNLSSAQAQTAAAAALAAYDPPTHAEMTAELATADDATLAAIAARPSVADFWSGITATAARFIADHTLRRSWASAAVSANGDTLSFRSLLGAVAKLVNRVGITGATLTVYQDDDTTALGTQAVTSDAAAEPVTGVNTV